LHLISSASTINDTYLSAARNTFYGGGLLGFWGRTNAFDSSNGVSIEGIVRLGFIWGIQPTPKGAVVKKSPK
jgi:hypothetical protein